MTQLCVTTTDTDRAIALLHRLEDVSADRHTVATVEGRTITATIAECDMPAVQQVLAYHHDWIATIS